MPIDESEMQILQKGINDVAFKNRFDKIYSAVHRHISRIIDFNECSVLDFGCGDGTAALRFALQHPESCVYGADIDDTFKRLKKNVNSQLRLSQVPTNLHLSQIEPGQQLPVPDGSIDFVFSWSVFEHVNSRIMSEVIADIKRSLKARGFIFVQIDPLFFSRRGAHLYQYLSEPWVHLIEQHDSLRNLLFAETERNDPEYIAKERLWQQYETLNRITSPELIRQFENAGFELIRQELTIEDEPVPVPLGEIYSSEALLTRQIIAIFRSI